MEPISKVQKEKSTPTKDIQKIISSLVGAIPHTEKLLEELRDERLEKKRQ